VVRVAAGLEVLVAGGATIGDRVHVIHLMGAISDPQAKRVRELVEGAGQAFDYRSFPSTGHSMHGQDPQLFVTTVVDWYESQPVHT